MFKFFNTKFALKLNSKCPIKVDSNGIDINIKKPLATENNNLKGKYDGYFDYLGKIVIH